MSQGGAHSLSNVWACWVCERLNEAPQLRVRASDDDKPQRKFKASSVTEWYEEEGLRLVLIFICEACDFDFKSRA